MGPLAHLREVPVESRSWKHLWYPVWTMGALGVARGLDEGIISGVLNQESFKSAFKFESGSDIENQIASMLQAGSVVGSILAFIVSDMLGRKRTAQLACILWAVGTIIWMQSAGGIAAHNGRLAQLLAGRFVAGLGVGITPVVAPTYLTEIAPRAIRGLCCCTFSGAVYIGILLGYFSNYGTALHISSTDSRQWKIPASLNFIFAGLIFVNSFFIPESPRWLLKVDREEEAHRALFWLRNRGNADDEVNEEYDAIACEVDVEHATIAGSKWYAVFWSLVTDKTNLHVLCIGVGLQLFGQFSGGGSMTVFAPKLFQFVGVQKKDNKLLITGIFGIVKLLSSLAAAFFIVDLMGRKVAVMSGLTIQAISTLYLTIYLRYHYDDTAASSSHASPAQKHMANAAIFFIFFSGFAWAVGVNSVQYLSQTEMFSLKVRSLGVAIVSVLHFLCQFGSSRSVDPIVSAGGPYSLFLFFFIMSLASLVFVFFTMPEVSGYALESVKELFTEKPWYLVGCTQNRPLRARREVDEPIEDLSDLPKSAGQLGGAQMVSTPTSAYSGGSIDKEKMEFEQHITRTQNA